MTKKKNKLVYSTRPEAALDTDGPILLKISLPPKSQTIRVRPEKKGRGGKVVTVAEGFQLTSSDLKDLQKMLKKFCGSGGTCKTNTIEIQGDHCTKVVEKLTELGYQAKRAGG